jgi:hypothetical protein
LAVLILINLNLFLQLNKKIVDNEMVLLVMDFMKNYGRSLEEEDEYTYDIINKWVGDLLHKNRIFDERGFKNPETTVLKYISNYYSNYVYRELVRITMKLMVPGHIKYYLILNNKHEKIKYTINNWGGTTEVTMSAGVLLKNLGSFKKSMKKSIKAHILFVKFIRNTITRLIKKNAYIFVVRGLNLRFFKLVNLLNFAKMSSNISLYFLDPKISQKKAFKKRVKSIKRKLQKKNLTKINELFTFYKTFTKSELKI